MGRHSIQYPEDRLAKIAFLPQQSGLLSDKTAEAWGMAMDPRMMQVEARILGTDDLVYGNKKKINPGTTGAWNLRDTRHFAPIQLNSWAVVSLLGDTTGAQVGVGDFFGGGCTICEVNTPTHHTGVPKRSGPRS